MRLTNPGLSLYIPSAMTRHRQLEDYFDCIIAARVARINKYLFTKEDISRQLSQGEVDLRLTPGFIIRDIRVETVYHHSKLFADQVELWLATCTDEELANWHNAEKWIMDISETKFPWTEALNLILLCIEGTNEEVMERFSRPGDTYEEFSRRATDVLGRTHELKAVHSCFLKGYKEIAKARLVVLWEFMERTGRLKGYDMAHTAPMWWNGDVWRYERRPDDWSDYARPDTVRHAWTPPEASLIRTA